MNRISSDEETGKPSHEDDRHRRRARMASALLFIVCGLPGLFIMMVSSLGLFGRFYDPAANDTEIHPLLLTLCAVAGAFLMLAGVGLWRQWAYLLVFAAIPISLTVFIMIDARATWGSASLAVFVAIFVFGSLYLVRAFYSRRNKQRRDV